MRAASLAATGSRWAVATPHRFASEVAADAFAAGGNAVDAALHAAVTLAVVYPHMCGVGGDLFALVHRPDGADAAIDSSGRAPAAIDVPALRSAHGTAMPESGPATITVPGAVAGWEALHRRGAAMPWPTAFVGWNSVPTIISSSHLPSPSSSHAYDRSCAGVPRLNLT
jgi:gamma-glutamyltranspeptidase